MVDKRKVHSTYTKTSNKYKKVYLPREGDTPARVVEEHRLQLERKLGRKLKRDEAVHHKDGDRSNGADDNLEVISLGENTAKSNRKRAKK